jgi:hypothetical protein
MGLDRFQKTPCGFCFVEYYTHQDALDCMKYIGGTKLDERVIRTDLDEGFAEGRQYGYANQWLYTGTLADTGAVEANLAARYATSIATSSTPVAAVTVEPTPMSMIDHRTRRARCIIPGMGGVWRWAFLLRHMASLDFMEWMASLVEPGLGLG